MANSRKTIATYRGTGAQKVFAFNFDYLQKAFIKVSVDGVVLTYGVDYTVVNRQVELLTAPAVDVLVIVYRETSTSRLVSWEDASVLRAADMTLFEVQLLHIAEETQDKVQDSGMALDPEDNIWDARFHKIKNVNDPTMPEDVVTKRHFDEFKGSLADSQASEAAAKVSETNAKTSENNAKASEAAAKASEEAAKVSETNAKASENVVVPLVPTVQEASQAAAIASTQAAQAAANAQLAVDTVKSLGAVPIGMFVPFMSATAVPGYLMLSGPNKVSSFDRLLYPDLYAYLGTDQLPDFTNRFPQGAGDKINGGAVKAWRLPAFGTNTTGAHMHTTSALSSATVSWETGAGSMGYVNQGTSSTSSSGSHSHTLSVPAGNTDTYLAPDAVGVYWAIKAFGALASEGAVSAAKLVEDVANINPNTFGRNKLINGGFDIWQRGTSFVLTSTSSESGFCADRFLYNVEPDGGTKSVGFYRVTPDNEEVGLPENTRAYLKFNNTVTSPGVLASSSFRQKIEGVKNLSGRKATLSFYCYGSASGNIQVQLYQDFGRGGSPSASVFLPTQTVQVPTGQWKRVSLTFDVPSVKEKTLGTNGDDALVVWVHATAGNSMASTYNITGGAFNYVGSLNFAQMQLEEGEVATPFEHRFIGLELQMCQRYYETGFLSLTGSGYTAGAMVGTFINFAVQKRVYPALNMLTPSENTNFATLNASVFGFGGFRYFGYVYSPGNAYVSRPYTADAEL